jgi:SAM-dependent methyltransferase
MSVDPDAYQDLARLRAKSTLATHYAIMVFIELRLPTLIASGVCTTEVVIVDGGEWSLDRLGELLTEDHPIGACRFMHPDGAQRRLNAAFAGLSHTIRTGESGYRAVYGNTLWSDFREHPALARSFAEYMVVTSSTWVSSLTDAYDWRRTNELIDVGGGLGNVSAALLMAHPHLSATVLDQPQLEKWTTARFAEAGLTARARFLAGNFFDELPTGCDTALLAHVLHDWQDDEATTILRRCAQAVGPSGRVLVVDIVRGLGSPETSVSDSQSSLTMHLLFASEERTQTQWHALLDRADLRIAATNFLHGSCHMLECVPV